MFPKLYKIFILYNRVVTFPSMRLSSWDLYCTTVLPICKGEGATIAIEQKSNRPHVKKGSAEQYETPLGWHICFCGHSRRTSQSPALPCAYFDVYRLAPDRRSTSLTRFFLSSATPPSPLCLRFGKIISHSPSSLVSRARSIP